MTEKKLNRVYLQTITSSENSLESINACIVTDSKDWALNRRDAWLYGIVAGWDDALDKVAKRFNWNKNDKHRLRRLNLQYQRLRRCFRWGRY